MVAPCNCDNCKNKIIYIDKEEKLIELEELEDLYNYKDYLVYQKNNKYDQWILNFIEMEIKKVKSLLCT